MSVKKIVYIGLLPLLPLLLILNSGFLYREGTLIELQDPQEYSGIDISEDYTDSRRDTFPAAENRSAGTEYLLLSGGVRPRDEVDIFPDTQGKIRELRVEAGDFVDADEILAMVDPSRPGMNYILSPVKSSIRGTVTAVFTDPGAFISPGQPLCRVGTLSELEVEVYVPEGFIADVYKGMKADVSSPVIPELNETLVLDQISPVVDPMSRSMKVVFIPENKSSRLKSGMYVDLKIKLE